MNGVAAKAGGKLVISTMDQLGPDASREDGMREREQRFGAVWASGSCVIGITGTFGFHMILFTCFTKRFDRNFHIVWLRRSVSSASCVG